MAVGKGQNGLVTLLERAFRIAARMAGDDRLLLTADERTDLSAALTEFARHHDVPVLSPVWASRIGLAASIGALAVARADVIMGTPPAASRADQAVPRVFDVAPEPEPAGDWLGAHSTH